MSTKTRWRRRKEARPGEIIDAALTLFAQHGFNATKLEDVAAEAGVSKGTVYLYFGSKEALFRAMVEEMIIPVVARAEANAAEFQGSQTELVRQLVYEWWRSVGKTRLANMPKLMVSEAAHFPELARFYVDNVVRRARKLLEDALHKGIENGEFRQCDVKCAARALLFPLVFSVIWEKSLAQYDSEKYEMDACIDTHLSIFLNGLSKKSGEVYHA